jgi:hypothetical protein
MLGSNSSLVAVSLTALALLVTPAEAQASPKHRAKGARVARVVSQHPCSKRPVEVISGKESATFALAKCDGTASPEGVDQISLLARPSGVARPKEPLAVLASTHGVELAPGIRRLDPRLVEKLELVVDQFRKAGRSEHLVLAPGVSSSPASGSHRGMARTIDFRIQGVKGDAIASFCKTVPDAACGSSPHGPFVRMELRDIGANSATDADPAAPVQPGSATAAPGTTVAGGRLAPLPSSDRPAAERPSADHPAAASMLKPAESEHFL